MTQLTKGYLFAFSAMSISGLAVFSNSLVVKGIDPIVHTTIKNGFAGFLVMATLLLGRQLPDLKTHLKTSWPKLLVISIIGGSVPFALFFTGLKGITAPEGQLINKTLVIWASLLAVPLLKEKLTNKMVAGVSLVYGSSLLAGGWRASNLVEGHWMVLLATVMWATEAVLIRKWLKDVPVNVLLTARMGVGSIWLTALLLTTNKAPLVAALSVQQWGLLLLVGGILFGYVMTWYRAFKYLPVTVVSSVMAGAVVITTLMDAVFMGKQLSSQFAVTSILLLSGIYWVSMGLIDLWRGKNLKGLKQTYA